MLRTATTCLAVSACLVAVTSAQRSSRAHPDLSGLWSNGTVTQLQRPAEFAEKPVLTEAEAAEYERTALDRLHKAFSAEDLLAPDIDYTYMDRMKVVASRRTSLIIDPSDGKLPPLLPAAKARAD